jgi:hypothetical protein
MRELLNLITVMENPLSLVKNSRTVYRKDLERPVTEVLVQVKDEPPSWIPLETLLALQSVRNDIQN